MEDPQGGQPCSDPCLFYGIVSVFCWRFFVLPKAFSPWGKVSPQVTDEGRAADSTVLSCALICFGQEKVFWKTRREVSSAAAPVALRFRVLLLFSASTQQHHQQHHQQGQCHQGGGDDGVDAHRLGGDPDVL